MVWTIEGNRVRRVGCILDYVRGISRVVRSQYGDDEDRQK